MKKALILGVNAGQADIINYLRETGWEVHACGFKKEGPGVELAHQFHLINTTDIEAVKELAIKLSTDIVYSVSSDTNIHSATKVSEELGLPYLLGTEIIELFHHKDRLRDFLNQENISFVAYKQVTRSSQLMEWNEFPCVVKPTDSQGQRGVQLINGKDKLMDAVEFAISQSATNKAIVEEFLTGIEVSSNIIVQNGEVLINEFTERLVFEEGYFGLPKGHSIPVRKVNKETIEEAANIVVEFVDRLKIKNAVLYIQMKITEKGPKIIEVAPRLDGCHIWRLLKIAKGYDLRKLAIDLLVGNKLKIERSENNEEMTLAFHHLKTGSKFEVSSLQKINDVVYNEYRYVDGDQVQPINGQLEVVGYYIKKE